MTRRFMPLHVILPGRGVFAFLFCALICNDWQSILLGCEGMSIVPLRAGRKMSLEALLLGRYEGAPSRGAFEWLGVLIGVNFQLGLLGECGRAV